MALDGVSRALQVVVDLEGRLNFAVQQNAVPVIRDLRLVNDGEARLEDLELRVTTDPVVSAPWSARVAAIDPGQTFALGEVDLPLSATALVQQNERQAGALCVEVAGPGGVLHTERFGMEVLAYNEWAGAGGLPELLAAFVLPNHPGVSRLLKAARDHLERATGDPALDGYQSRDPRRVAAMAEAVFAAVGALGVTYVNPPASFEATGQKIRSPDQLLDDQMGTCLDLSVVMAAALEQMGLNTLVVIVQGHAFPGVWLTDFRLAQPTLDDPLPVRKRVELGEALVFDSSSAASRAPFARAVEVANRHLADAERFRYAVDVAAARTARILPLPMRQRTEAGFQVLAEAPQTSAASDDGPAFVLPTRPQAPSDATRDASPRSRLERWKSKLLDLSLRNRLLNFRATRRTLPLMAPDLAALEDALASGRPFELLPRPRTLEEEGRSARVHETRTGEDPERALLFDALDHRRIHVDLAPAELDKRVVELYRSARSSMEESGAITLYLALGMLRWFESPSSEQPREAPLLLIPAEIVRGPVTEPYRLRLADEEARVNVTLLQKLQLDFGLDVRGLDELTEDEAGLDVPAILDRFRRLVRDVARWEVVGAAWVGEFSFTKFLMWLDLEARTEALLQSPVVRHLFEGEGQPFPLARPFTTPAEIDRERAAADDLCVVEADSSQRAAVFGAVDGNSFVLQGPPGTGKSQTITNLIAGALARGKTVLFVSEKMAALDVVHDRLGRVGLGPMCLEAHSNKASRLSIVRQLGEPFTVARERERSEWAALADRLGALRAELNEHAELMHRPGPFGESAFQVTSRLVGLRAASRVPLDVDPPDRDTLVRMREAVGALVVAAADVGVPDQHPLAAVGRAQWDPRFAREASETLARARRALGELAARAGEAGEALGLERPKDPSAAGRLASLGQVLLETPAPPRALVDGGGWAERRARVEALVAHAARRSASWRELQPGWTDRLLGLDLDDLRARFARWGEAFFLFAFIFLWSARRTLRPARRDGSLPPNREITPALDTALAVRAEDRALADADAEARSLLGGAWAGADTDPGAVERLLAWVERLRSALLDLRERGELADDGALLRLATDDAELLAPDRRAGAALTALQAAHDGWGAAWTVLADLLELGDVAHEGFDDLDAALASMEAALPRLRDWCAWRRAAADVRALGLGPLVDAHFRGELGRDALAPAFERSVREAWLEDVMAADPRLGGFRGRDHEARIAEFRAIDARSHAVAREEVMARILSRLPDLDAPGEMAVLRRELRKKRGHKPIRKLFSEIPTTLLRIKPCVLMSPLSVAQYLEPSLDAFDLVVFDEASQIPPWDAVGAIARGRSVVVVGDSKQLPPTSFFDRGSEDDEALDDEDQIDLESILDDCVAAGLPSHALRWHYRSRHEALIAFSNHHYYDNGLHTFPAAQAEVPHLGVKWRSVDGFYDKGRSRTNRAEAEAVVADVVERLTDPARRHQSLGVVTFSQTQQRLIEDLLDAARRDHPAIERYFGDQVDEPVFVKNLENVQGDERDVMLFSICYGPDPQGRVSMNFGPLNRQGGERRLNVAITRARELLVVFSTLTSDRIDLSRTRAVGVRHLQTFLDYARRGQVAIEEAAAADPDAEFGSPLEADIADAIEARGYELHRQVGCSGYRIDLAVVDPERPGAYLLAIECDGASYHSARCARDRDRIRQSVLESLGWRFHRIWSTDWWLDRDAELERAIAAIERAKEDAARPPPPPPPAPELEDDAPTELVLPPESAGPTWPSQAAPYRRLACPALGSSEAFEAAETVSRIGERLAEVVRDEGPVHVDEAVRRVAECWGVPRMTARIRRRVLDAARSLAAARRPTERDGFLWPPELDPDTWDGFRFADGGEARSAEHVSVEEIANVAAWTVGRAVVIEREELAREVARVFGITRMGKRVAARMDEGIALLERRGRALCEEGRVREPAGGRSPG